MARNDTITILRGEGAPPDLSYGELAYDSANNILYIGNPAGVPIAVSIMRNVFIQSSPQTPGNLTLTDAVNWAAQYAFLSSVKIKTASTNFDLYLCETSAFDTALISTRQLVSGGTGDMDITVDREYNPDAAAVYLKYVDNSGANTATFYVVGQMRRH